MEFEGKSLSMLSFWTVENRNIYNSVFMADRAFYVRVY